MFKDEIQEILAHTEIDNNTQIEILDKKIRFFTNHAEVFAKLFRLFKDLFEGESSYNDFIEGEEQKVSCDRILKVVFKDSYENHIFLETPIYVTQGTGLLIKGILSDYPEEEENNAKTQA